MFVVSGGRGFLGKRLVERLAKDGPVVSIVRGDSLAQVGNCFEIGCENAALGDILKQTTVFIHTAGKLRGSWTELKSANVESVRFYIDVLPKDLQRVIAFSSVNVFFSQYNDYGRSKWMAEEAWRSSLFVDRLILLRPSWIYGPQDGNNLYPLIRMVQRAPRLLPIPGNIRMRPVFIEDVIGLTIEMSLRRETDPGAWVVAGAEVVSWQDLVERIAALLNKKVRCVMIPRQLIEVMAKAAGGLGTKQINQRLMSFSTDKLWYEEAVWRILDREPTRLEYGLQKSVESYMLSRA